MNPYRRRPHSHDRATAGPPARLSDTVEGPQPAEPVEASPELVQGLPSAPSFFPRRSTRTPFEKIRLGLERLEPIRQRRLR